MGIAWLHGKHGEMHQGVMRWAGYTQHERRCCSRTAGPCRLRTSCFARACTVPQPWWAVPILPLFCSHLVLPWCRAISCCWLQSHAQVSPGYAEEIKGWLGGCGMEGLLSNRGFVLNGEPTRISKDFILMFCVWGCWHGMLA